MSVLDPLLGVALMLAITAGAAAAGVAALVGLGRLEKSVVTVPATYRRDHTHR